MRRNPIPEEWRTISRYDCKYEISNLGRVRRISYLLHPSKNPGGYLIQLFNHNGQIHGHSVHRLVAEAFLGIPAKGRIQINHKDGNKTNNVPSNLEWCTAAHNCKHRHVLHPTMQQGSKNNYSKLTESQALWAWKMRGKLSQKAIAERFGVLRETISRIHQGRNWAHVTKVKVVKSTQGYHKL